MKESDIQKAIMQYLAAKRIFHMRMNVGAMGGEHNGKKWFVRFGYPGVADVLAFPCEVYEPKGLNIDIIIPSWIEIKNEKGKQSPQQKDFQKRVEEEGHRYILARSVDDVIAAGI